MRDLIILSEKPITYESIIGIIRTNFKKYNFLRDDKDLIYIKKKRSGFELELTPNDILDDPNNMMDDTINRCPNKKAHLTNLNYSTLDIAKKLISLIIDNYGSMWIQSDEDDDFFGTAVEFLNNYTL